MRKKGKHQHAGEDQAEGADNVTGGDVADEVIKTAFETVPLAEFEALQARFQEAVEVNLRQRADFENTRKRLRRAADEAGNRSLANFIRPVLVELDNLTLAIEHARPESFAEFAQGVTMIQDNLLAIFIGSGIELITTDGIFDPAVHEVVAEVEVDEPRGTIVAVQRTGYRLGDQVVRAAQVIVARGTPAATMAAEPAEEAEET